MPNLQELEPFFRELIQQWIELTLLNAPYAISLAVSVWLLTAIGYSIIIAAWKRRLKTEYQARVAAQGSLDMAQQQLQALEAQLGDVSGQLEQVSQDAALKSQQVEQLEGKLAVGQKKLADCFASLAKHFELLETLTPQEASDIETLAQRLAAIIERVSERFQNEQQAKARLQLDVQVEKTRAADKDLQLNNLQSQLQSQEEKLAELEQVAGQQQLLQQELAGVKQQLNEALAQNRVDATKLAELSARSSVPQAAVSVAPDTVIPAVPVAPAPAPEPVKVQVEPAKPVEPPAPIVEAVRPVEVKPTVPEKPAPEVTKSVPVKAVKAETSAGKGKWKSMFGNAMQQFSKLDEKLGSPSEPKVKAVSESSEPAVSVVEAIVEPEPQPVIETRKEQPVASASGKLGGMFGGFKKSAKKPAADETPVAEATVSESLEKIPEPEAAKKTSKLGGLMGKFKKS